MNTTSIVPITAIVTAYDRAEVTLETIRQLKACNPPPCEILVHLDNGADIRLPEGVRIFRSKLNIGPGGGRNLLISESANDWVASFDDDSYPATTDYFASVVRVIQRHPNAGVIATKIKHRNPHHDAVTIERDQEVASFVGCGCVYRKQAFLQTVGYIPLPVAYGMEEVDLSFQLLALGHSIIETPDLTVVHDTDLGHHCTPRIAAGSIMNQALLIWVRYPFAKFPFGILQWANKIFDNFKRRRILGVLIGVIGSPLHVWSFRSLRQPVSLDVFRRFRVLSRGNRENLSNSSSE